MKDRRVKVPEFNGIIYRASCQTTGEVLECTDLAPLFRNIAKSYEYRQDKVNRGKMKWTIEET